MAVMLSCFWILLIFVSVWGYGSALIQAFKVECDGWLAPIFGLSLFTFMGGLLATVGLANGTVLTLLVLAGLALAALQTFPFLKDIFAEWRPNVGVEYLIVIGTALFIIMASVKLSDEFFNPDDQEGYGSIVADMRANGTMGQPLSFRRAMTYGGQFPLQTAMVALDTPDSLYAYDVSLGIACLAAMGLFFLRDAPPNRRVLLAILFSGALILPVAKNNSAPALLVTCTLLAGLLTLISGRGWKLAFLGGLCLGTAITMRMQSLAFVGLFSAGYAVFCLLEKERRIDLIGYVAGAGLAVAPFVLMQWQLFETPLPSLWTGTLNPDIVNFSAGGLFSVGIIGTLLTTEQYLAGLVLVVGLLAWKRPELVLVVGACLIATLVVVVATSGTRIFDAWRYTWPIVSAVGLLFLIYPLKNGFQGRFVTWLAVLVLAGFPSLRFGIQSINSMGSQLHKTLGRTELFNIDRASPGVLAQNLIPEGTKFMVVGDYPYYLDFSRNTILNLDIPGDLASQPMHDAIAFKGWLKDMGVEYILAPDFNIPGFSWSRASVDNIEGRPFFDDILRPAKLQTMEMIDVLAADPGTMSQNGYRAIPLG